MSGVLPMDSELITQLAAQEEKRVSASLSDGRRVTFERNGTKVRFTIRLNSATISVDKGQEVEAQEQEPTS